MILAKLKLDEEVKLDFDLQVVGTAENVASTRLVIEAKDFDIVCHCATTAEGIEAKIPKLKGILESGEYTTRLEVILGDKIFQPLTESIEFEPLVEMDVKPKSIEPVKEGVRVSVKTKLDVKSKNPDLDKALAEGHQVVKYGDFDILKKGSDYVGIVTESKVLKSATKHSTLTSLIDELSR